MLISPASPIVDPAPFVETALGYEQGMAATAGSFRDAALDVPRGRATAARRHSRSPPSPSCSGELLEERVRSLG